MRSVTLALSGAAMVALLAGCSESNQGTQTASIPSEASHLSAPIPQGTPIPKPAKKPARPGWLSPPAQSGPLMYVADDGGEVYIYPESGYNQSPIGMITSGINGTWGLYVDQNGNLYAANTGNNTVTVYPPGSIDPSATYSQDLNRPLYPIVDGSGNLWVSNANNGTVVEYRAGSTNPYQVLQTLGVEADGMDFDQQGNLYVAYRTTDGVDSIEKFIPGSTQGQTLGMTLNQPQGVIVDRRGNVLAVETGGPTKRRIDDVLVFSPGANTPKFTLKLPKGAVPNQLAITADESLLFVASWTNGAVYVTGYPLRKRSSWTVLDDVQGAYGIALSNGQVF